MAHLFLQKNVPDSLEQLSDILVFLSTAVCLRREDEPVRDEENCGLLLIFNAIAEEMAELRELARLARAS